ncbi:hypothetical protein C8J57DRAFT_1624752 [Mycena rebaudengoi]|nr:hypothetical protein C8J57DRAFT_1624752 [Mycena rebaudengoi]
MPRSYTPGIEWRGRRIPAVRTTAHAAYRSARVESILDHLRHLVSKTAEEETGESQLFSLPHHPLLARLEVFSCLILALKLCSDVSKDPGHLSRAASMSISGIKVSETPCPSTILHVFNLAVYGRNTSRYTRCARCSGIPTYALRVLEATAVCAHDHASLGRAKHLRGPLPEHAVDDVDAALDGRTHDIDPRADHGREARACGVRVPQLGSPFAGMQHFARPLSTVGRTGHCRRGRRARGARCARHAREALHALAAGAVPGTLGAAREVFARREGQQHVEEPVRHLGDGARLDPSVQRGQLEVIGGVAGQTRWNPSAKGGESVVGAIGRPGDQRSVRREDGQLAVMRVAFAAWPGR